VKPPTVGWVVSADGIACFVQVVPPSVVTQSSPGPGLAPPTATQSLDELHETLSGPVVALPTTCSVHVDPPLVVVQIAPSVLVSEPTATQSPADGHETALSDPASATLFSVHDPADPPVLGPVLAVVVVVPLLAVPFPRGVDPDVCVFPLGAEPQPAVRSSATARIDSSCPALRVDIVVPAFEWWFMTSRRQDAASVAVAGVIRRGPGEPRGSSRLAGVLVSELVD
jgi:hypothetical protein